MDVDAVGTKRRRTGYALSELSAAFELELAAFARFREVPLHQDRASVAVTERTVANDRKNVLR